MGLGRCALLHDWPGPVSDPPPAGREPFRAGLADRTQRVTGWMRWLPGSRALRHYQIAWLRHDLVASTVLTSVLVPVGIAYAVASGLPANSDL